VGKLEPNLAPHLRELDQRVEQVELSLRKLIQTNLDDDESLIPIHFAQRVKERVFISRTFLVASFQCHLS
jgi:hypothetical protein